MFISGSQLQYLKLHIAVVLFPSVVADFGQKGHTSQLNYPFLTFHSPPRRQVYKSLYRSDSQITCMMFRLNISIYQCWQKPACWVKPVGSCPPRRAPPPPAWCTASTSLTCRRKKNSNLNFKSPSIYHRKAYLVKRPLLPETSSSCRKQVPAGGRFSECSRVLDKNRYIFKVAFVKSATRGEERWMAGVWLLFIPPLQSSKKCLRTSNCYELWEASTTPILLRCLRNRISRNSMSVGLLWSATNQIVI